MSSRLNSKDSLNNTQKKLESVSSSFCLAKWKNSTLHLHNGHTQSCHHVRSQKFSIDPNNPSSLHNSEDKIVSREKMLTGKRPSECSYCWKVEDRGHISDRVIKSNNPVYMETFDEVVSSETGREINPSFLEISFDHKCQFTCLYCNPAYSTSWEKELKDHGQYKTYGNLLNQKYNQSRLALKKAEREKNIEAFWNWWPELQNSLRYLRVTGGEPLLSKETFRLIDELSKIKNRNLHFAINSNLGVQQNLIDRFIEKCPELQKNILHYSLYTSIDTIGPRAEYIRHGLNEKEFWENCEKVLSSIEKKITLCFMITVNALSLFGLKELLLKINQLAEKYPQHEIRFDTPYVQYPAHLSVEILPKSFRKFAEETYEWAVDQKNFSEEEKNGLRRLPDLIGSGSYNPAVLYLLRQDFSRFIDESDRRKGTSFKETFPELVEFKESCSHKMKNFKQSFLNREAQI